MKTLYKIIYIAMVLLAFGAAAANGVVKPFALSTFAIPPKYKGELENYRKSWNRLTGFEYSGLHWNQFIVVYSNLGADTYLNNYLEYLRYYQYEDEDEDEVEAPNFHSYPAGTILLKENYSALKGSPKVPVSITMMIKREKGYDTQGGNWEYVQFDQMGNIMLNGHSRDASVNKACASCHINIAERDYIFSSYYSKPGS